ncbi:MAG: hypothetical protein RIM33_16150 [Alphaproteobacteria bacterium]
MGSINDTSGGIKAGSTGAAWQKRKPENVSEYSSETAMRHTKKSEVTICHSVGVLAAFSSIPGDFVALQHENAAMRESMKLEK